MQELIKNIPPFYKEVFKANIKINNLQYNKIDTIAALLQQPLWKHSHQT